MCRIYYFHRPFQNKLIIWFFVHPSKHLRHQKFVLWGHVFRFSKLHWGNAEVLKADVGSELCCIASFQRMLKNIFVSNSQRGEEKISNNGEGTSSIIEPEKSKPVNADQAWLAAWARNILWQNSKFLTAIGPMEPTWTCRHPSASKSSCDLSSLIAVRENESCDSSLIVVRTWIWNTTYLKKATVLENKQEAMSTISKKQCGQKARSNVDNKQELEAMWTRSKKQEATLAGQQLPRNVSNCRTVGECTVVNLPYFTVPHIIWLDSGRVR